MSPSKERKAAIAERSQQPKKQPSGLKLTPKLTRYILIGLLFLMAIIFLTVSTKGVSRLSDKSQLLVEAKLKSKTADAQLTSLEGAKKQIDKYSYFNDVAKTVIPNDKDQAQAVLDITQQADRAGISLASITFPASNLGGTKPVSAAGTAATSTAVSQAVPVAGINGLYSLQLTIVPLTGPTVPAGKVVTYPKLLDFLSRIERDRRTAQIAQVSISPQSDNSGPTGEINFTLVINVFIRPEK